MPASARLYAEMRPLERSAVRELDDADSITVMTVIEKTTVTASAITSAKPCSFAITCRSRFISDPRAVPEIDRVGQLVRVDRLTAPDADLEVHVEVLEAAA